MQSCVALKRCDASVAKPSRDYTRDMCSGSIAVIQCTQYERHAITNFSTAGQVVDVVLQQRHSHPGVVLGNITVESTGYMLLAIFTTALEMLKTSHPVYLIIRHGAQSLLTIVCAYE